MENKALGEARHFHKVNLFSPELQELFDELKKKYEKAVDERTEQIKGIVEKIINSSYSVGYIQATYHSGRIDFQKVMTGKDLKEKILKQIEGLNKG